MVPFRPQIAPKILKTAKKTDRKLMDIPRETDPKKTDTLEETDSEETETLLFENFEHYHIPDEVGNFYGDIFCTFMEVGRQ